MDDSNSGASDDRSDSVVKGLSQSRDKGLNFEGKKSNSAGESNPNSTFTERNSLVSEGILAGQRIAKISVVTLVSIGIVEILTGYYSGSVVATADGLDSISDAAISFIVLLGLRIAHRPADKKFHFGYHKVESFAALMAAIGMVAIGIVIFYNSYQVILHPHEIRQPVLTMVVLAVSWCSLIT